MSTREFALASRILAALKVGPRTAGEVALLLRVTREKVTDSIKGLREKELVVRVDADGGRRPGTYALAEHCQAAVVSVRGAVFVEMENAYIAARRKGEPSETLRRDMGLSSTAVRIFEARWTQQSTGHNLPDSSTPKFARDDLHLAGVLKHGGYCAFSQSQSGFEPAICKPVIWPARAA